MSTQQTIPSDLYVAGSFTCQAFNPPASCIDNDAVAGPTSSKGVDASKLEHRISKILAQLHGTIATAERRVVHVVRGTTGLILDFSCGVVVANIGAATITIDLKKNGTTILTATTVLDSTNTAYSLEAADGFTSTALLAADVLEVVVVVAAGGGTLGQGLFCHLTLNEDPA